MQLKSTEIKKNTTYFTGSQLTKLNLRSDYLIKGTTQNCTSNTDVFNRKCTTNVWFVAIAENGKEISNKVLEEIE